ncbi:hypothetical protein ISN44_As11g026540 [Arabidopsis suecica]|uniref:Uncharacterized protein n=1 Tax=Arabidopsis suecica TaxID=45249 RepID=A0A8T1ZC65_ARASU|nr:hypothetical protein ISN44_As11g026540 [Arabidopsis suecica]
MVLVAVALVELLIRRNTRKRSSEKLNVFPISFCFLFFFFVCRCFHQPPSCTNHLQNNLVLCFFLSYEQKQSQIKSFSFTISKPRHNHNVSLQEVSTKTRKIPSMEIS